MRRLKQAILCCAPVFAVTGCLPIIAHTPRVERGTHFSMAGGFAAGQLTNPEDSVRYGFAPLPAFAVRESYGMRSSRDADRFAAEFGAELIFVTGFAADAYIQAPPRWTGETDLGVGAAALGGAFAGTMIYGQVGRKASNGYYLFTTQSLARLTRRSNLQGGNNRPAISWQPTIAVEPIRAWTPIHYFFLTATIGRTFNGCIRVFLGCYDSSRASIAVGAAISSSPEDRLRRRADYSRRGR